MAALKRSRIASESLKGPNSRQRQKLYDAKAQSGKQEKENRKSKDEK